MRLLTYSTYLENEFQQTQRCSSVLSVDKILSAILGLNFFVYFVFPDILANRNHHEQFGELLQQLNDNETNSKTLYVDAMFVDSQTRIRSVFKDYLTTVYHGEARGVNFTQKNEVKQMINE